MRTSFSEEVTPSEVDKMFTNLERFKTFSVFLSDESLMKLMTSLIAMSLNNLAVGASSNTGYDTL
jgi:hypothetical protein